MAKLINQDELVKLVKDEIIMKRGNVDNVEGIKYDFRLSPLFLKSQFGKVVMNYNELEVRDRHNACIKPGELVYVASEEEVVLPDNMIIQLSPKRKLAHLAISVLGGMFVDPKYEGRLFVGLLNHSSRDFLLQPGRKLIAGVFYQLDKIEKKGEFTAPRIQVLEGGFPEELMDMVIDCQPSNTNAIKNDVSKLDTRIQTLEKKLKSDDAWDAWRESIRIEFEKFTSGLNRLEEKVESIANSLELEIEERKELGKTVSKLEKSNLFRHQIITFVGAIFFTMLGGIITWFFGRF